MTTLLIAQKGWFDYPFYAISSNVHHFENYKDIMEICGLALVITSRFISYQFVNPKQLARCEKGFNDCYRNAILLVGFLRDEKYALPLIARFKNERETNDPTYDETDPWHIDLQMAILDALEVINYKTLRIKHKVIKRLKLLRAIIDTSKNSIVKDQITEVIDTLELDAKEPVHIKMCQKLIEEFHIFIKEYTVRDINLLHYLYKFKPDSYDPKELGLRKEFDPIDDVIGVSFFNEAKKCLETKPDEALLREALKKVRIGYREIGPFPKPIGELSETQSEKCPQEDGN